MDGVHARGQVVSQYLLTDATKVTGIELHVQLLIYRLRVCGAALRLRADPQCLAYSAWQTIDIVRKQSLLLVRSPMCSSGCHGKTTFTGRNARLTHQALVWVISTWMSSHLIPHRADQHRLAGGLKAVRKGRSQQRPLSMLVDDVTADNHLRRKLSAVTRRHGAISATIVR